MKLPRVAIVSDLREEHWHSMDLIAEMLLLNLRTPESRQFEAIQICPAMIRRASRVPFIGRSHAAERADRIINRFWDYPRRLRDEAGDFDLFHVIDHSYAHLVTSLPSGRSLVTCHDLDAFQGVLPGSTGGSIVSRALGKRVVEGLKAARRVVCVSAATRDELLSYDVVPAARITVVPNGVHPTCGAWPDPGADREAASLLGPVDLNRPEVLHVGSTISRKRIDVLLETFAALRMRDPRVRLVRVGDTFTGSQERLVARLNLKNDIAVLPFVDRRVLAAIYRRAAVLLQPSDREGFGLPVAEAMASGTPVVASDIPALRGVGGDAVSYCPVGDVARWTFEVATLLEDRAANSDRWRARRAAGKAQAQRFNWREHAHRMNDVYQDVLAEISGRPISLTAAAIAG
jgi:glycosyltransferase involved in cell wall biosynthesis